jgi:hypothetical protein
MTLLGVLVLATLCAWLGSYVGSRSQGIAWNSQLGLSEHDMGLTGRIADSGSSTQAGWLTASPNMMGRYLLVTVSNVNGPNNFMLITTAAQEPLGVAIDCPFNAGDSSTIRLPGAHKGSQTMIANGAIGIGVDVFSAGNGQVMPVAGLNAAGVYWKVGRTVGVAPAVSAGDLIEVEACVPVKVVVVAALNSAQIVAAPTEANFNALQADVASIAGALASPSLVMVL